jgi:hypothetical protein
MSRSLLRLQASQNHLLQHHIYSHSVYSANTEQPGNAVNLLQDPCLQSVECPLCYTSYTYCQANGSSVPRHHLYISIHPQRIRLLGPWPVTILSGWTTTAAVVISAGLIATFSAFARRLPPICTQHGVVPLMVGLQDASVLGNLGLKNRLSTIPIITSSINVGLKLKRQSSSHEIKSHISSKRSQHEVRIQLDY